MVSKKNVLLCVVLSIVTCGIYAIYWFICLTEDTNRLAGDNDTSGIVAWLLSIVTCGIYGLFWAYKRGEKIDRAKQMRNIPANNGGILYLVLFIFGGIIAYALIQNEINNLADA